MNSCDDVVSRLVSSACTSLSIIMSGRKVLRFTRSYRSEFVLGMAVSGMILALVIIFTQELAGISS